MKELLELLAKELVDHPEEVLVTETTDDDAIILNLTVNDDDYGRVIGRGGRIANSIRNLLDAISRHQNLEKRVIVKIGEGRSRDQAATD